MAAGLTVSGVGALIVAWVLGDDFAPPEPGSWWVRAATVLVVGLLGWLVLLRRSHPDDSALPPSIFVTAGVALVLAVLAGREFVGQYLSGFPGRSTSLAALGGLAVTTGVLGTPSTTWRREPRTALSPR